MILTYSIPSLSGTFVIHARPALNPKMSKEPSSPSRYNLRIMSHHANSKEGQRKQLSVRVAGTAQHERCVDVTGNKTAAYG